MDEGENVLDGDAEGFGFGGAAVLEDGLGGLEHGGVRGTEEVVGVDDDIDASVGEDLLVSGGVGGGDRDQGDAARELVVGGAEGKDFVGGLGFGVDHDAVGPGVDVGLDAAESIFLSGASDEGLAAGDDHEVVGDTGGAAHFDLFNDGFDGGLTLVVAGFEEGVLLEAGLVLDDDSGDPKALESTDHVGKVVGEAAGVAVEDDGLGGDFKDVVDGVESGGEVDAFDVGLAFGGGVGQRREPHGVELNLAVVAGDGAVFDDEATESAVGLEDANEGLGVK